MTTAVAKTHFERSESGKRDAATASARPRSSALGGTPPATASVAPAWATTPSVPALGIGIVQRKTADCGTCGGGHSHGDGECEECKQKREAHTGVLRRSAISTRAGGAAPSIVRSVLQGSGQPLSASTRETMETHFARDFSHVRIHTGAHAAASARAVDAEAYTVGRHVVFGPTSYAPHTPAGRALLAHELTHVVQQSASEVIPATLTIGGRHDPAEHEACNAASALSNVSPARRNTPRVASRAGSAGLIQRDGFGDVRIHEGLEAEREARKKAPKAAGAMQGKILTDDETKTISAKLKEAKLLAPTPLAIPIGSKFILHDTSSPVGKAGIAKQVALGKGPMGKGVAGWVPRDTAPTIARPTFFEKGRPTPTEFEKGVERFAQPGDEKLKTGKMKLDAWKGRRDDLFRQVWNATKVDERNTAMQDALKGFGLTEAQIEEEKSGNVGKPEPKRAVQESLTPIADQMTNGFKGDVSTAAAWTIEKLCARVEAAGAKAIADAGKDKELEAACAQLGPLFFERGLRVGHATHVEIVQVGLKAPKKTKDGEKEKQNENTCDPSNPDLEPIPNPPYTDNQYLSIAHLYLDAALTAGRFPEVTTHFIFDAFISGHCDPRCFDLGKLYTVITKEVGHPAGCTYGPAPSYGRKWGTNNVWWDDTICGGKHP